MPRSALPQESDVDSPEDHGNADVYRQSWPDLVPEEKEIVRDGYNPNGKAIYTDGGSQYITMTGNAMYGNDMPSMGGSYEGPGTPYGDYRPDDGGQTGGQMAISEIAAYSMR